MIVGVPTTNVLEPIYSNEYGSRSRVRTADPLLVREVL